MVKAYKNVITCNGYTGKMFELPIITYIYLQEGGKIMREGWGKQNFEDICKYLNIPTN